MLGVSGRRLRLRLRSQSRDSRGADEMNVASGLISAGCRYVPPACPEGPQHSAESSEGCEPGSVHPGYVPRHRELFPRRFPLLADVPRGFARLRSRVRETRVVGSRDSFHAIKNSPEASNVQFLDTYTSAESAQPASESFQGWRASPNE